MPQKKPSIRTRIANIIAGKSYIPSLSSFDSIDGGAPLPSYATKAQQLRTNLGWVFAANEAIAEPTAAVQLKIGRRKKNGEMQDLGPHPILDLINNPSLAHDGETMRELHHGYLNLTGESYLLMVKAGKPFEVKAGVLPDALQVFPSHEVDFKLGKDRYSDSIVRYGGTNYKVTEVIRGFRPDPEQPYVGRSIIAANAASVDIDGQMKSHQRRMFQNNGRPGLVINLQGEHIDQGVRERLKEQVQTAFSGDNAFTSMVLENGEVKPYTLSPQDLDFLASREFTRDEILAMFKLPSALLGMIANFNRANIDGAFYINTVVNVVPRLRKEVRMWNNQLVQKYDPTLELYFDNPVPEDVEAKLKESQAGTNLWMTIDETRAERGLKPLENGLGAQLYLNQNNVPLQDIADGTAKPALAAAPGAAATNDSEDDGDDEAAPEGKKSVPKPRH